MRHALRSEIRRMDTSQLDEMIIECLQAKVNILESRVEELEELEKKVVGLEFTVSHLRELNKPRLLEPAE